MKTGFLVALAAASVLTGAAATAWAQSLQAPAGSYRASCSDVNAYRGPNGGKIVTARCRMANGGWFQSSLRFDGCRGDIANINGRLTCKSSPAPGPGPMPRGDPLEAEALRRLGAPEVGPGHRVPRRAGLAAPERVHHRQGGKGAGRPVERIEHGRDGLDCDERPRRVVDEHPVRRIGRQRLEAAPHGVAPAVRALDRRGQPRVVEGRRGRVIEVAVVRMDDNGQGIELWKGEQGACRPAEDGFRAEIAVLLGDRPAETGPAPGRNDQSRRPHGSFPGNSTGAYKAEAPPFTIDNAGGGACHTGDPLLGIGRVAYGLITCLLV